MTNKIAIAGAVLASLVVLGGIFFFAGVEVEAGDGGGQARPAPTTQLNLAEPDPSGSEPAPDEPYRPVPSEQVEGNLHISARTAGQTLYIPTPTGCAPEEIRLRGEHADRVEVEIRSLPMVMPSGVTTNADGYFSYGCVGSSGENDYAVVELAEPLGDRRLVLEPVFSTLPS